jgi:hypothetical protein
MPQSNEELALALTKDVLEKVSPKELPLADHFDPKQSSRGITAKGALGFGVEAAIPMLLPIVYLFFDGFIEEVKEDIKGAGKHVADGLIARVAALIRRNGATENDKVEATDAVLKYLVDGGIEKTRATEAAHVVIDVISKSRDAITA